MAAYIAWVLSLSALLGILLLLTRRGLLSPRQFGVIVATVTISVAAAGLYPGDGRG